MPRSARIWADAIGWVTYGSPVARSWPSRAPSEGFSRVATGSVPGQGAEIDASTQGHAAIGGHRHRREGERDPGVRLDQPDRPRALDERDEAAVRIDGDSPGDRPATQ